MTNAKNENAKNDLRDPELERDVVKANDYDAEIRKGNITQEKDSAKK